MIDEDGTSRGETPVFAEMKRRATEQLSALKIGNKAVSLALAAPSSTLPASTDSAKSQKRLALATPKNSSPVVSDTSDSEDDRPVRKGKAKRNSRSRRS